MLSDYAVCIHCQVIVIGHFCHAKIEMNLV